VLPLTATFMIHVAFLLIDVERSRFVDQAAQSVPGT
jgi:hypothetical protein